MRKILLGILAAVLLTAAGIGSSYVRRVLNEYESGHGKEINRDAEPDRIGFDTDYNGFYGIDMFETDLPVLYLTSDREINHDESVPCRLSVLNASGERTLHRVDETPDVTLIASVKNRGASSSHFEKAQYRIKLYSDEALTKEKQYDFFGMGRESEWILNGPFLDKTLCRNYTAYALSREILEWAPECRYVELFLNGQYRGVYLLTEPVSNGEGRLRLSKFGLLGGACGYIVGRDRLGSDTDPLNNYGTEQGYTSLCLYVEYPSKKSITDREFQWIEDDISVFEQVLFGEGYNDPVTGYAAYIDVDNFVDYLIINEIFMNHDSDLLSTYAYKELGGKLKLTVWDFNNSVDNYQWFAEDYETFFIEDGAWFHKLLKDRHFAELAVERYRELRKTTFSLAHMYEIIDGTTELLGPAVDRNFAVWGYTFRYNLVKHDARNPLSYGEAVTMFKEGLKKRVEFLDAHITDLYDFCE